MISFRAHALSLVAVLLSLAAGLFLGGGPLQRGEGELTRELEAEQARTRAARAEVAELERAVAFDDAFARTVGARLVSGALDDRSVSLLLLPGVDDGAVADVSRMVSAAGGRVAARVQLEPALFDVGNRELVEQLGQQLQRSAQKVEVPETAGAYDRLGLLLAHAVGTTGRTEPVDGAGDAVLAGLSTADLVGFEDTPTRRGNVVLMLAGTPQGDEDQRQGAASVAVALATALDRGTGGVVLAGPTAAASDGPLAAIRQDTAAAREVSTVDTLDRGAGAVVTVLAAAEQAAGGSGQYGVVAPADGAMPGTAAE